MHMHVSLVGGTLGQITNHPIPQFSGSTLLGGSGLYQSQTGGACSSGDRHKDFRVVCYREFIRSKIVEIFNWKTNHEEEHKTSNFACFLENQLFMDATSMEEYMNLETLKYRLQVLFQTKMIPVNCVQHVANCPEPVSLPSYTTRKNSGVLGLSFDQPNNSGSYLNPVGHTNQDMLSKEFSSGGYKLGAGSMLTIPNRNNVSSLDMVQAATKMLSPEQTPIITFSGAEGSCNTGAFENELLPGSRTSVKGFCHLGYLDDGKVNIKENRDCLGHKKNLHSVFFPSTSGAAFGCSGLNMQSSQDNLRTLSDLSGILPCNYNTISSSVLLEPQLNLLGSKKSRQWPYHSPFEAEEKYNTVGEPVDADMAYEQHQQPLKELNSGPHFQFSVGQMILLAYVEYRRSQMPEGDRQVSFVDFMHSEICSPHMCACGLFASLESHFDNCQNANCDVCGLVGHLSVTSNDLLSLENVKNGLIRDFGDVDSCGAGSRSSENMQPPLKRLKTQNTFCSSSPDNGIFRLLAPLANQNCDLELPALWQLPESPVSVTSEAMQVNMEMISNPIENFVSTRETENNTASNIHTSSAEADHSKDVLKSEETCAEEEVDLISISDLTGCTIDNSFELSPSILSEELVHSFAGGEVKVKNTISLKRPETKRCGSDMAPDSGCKDTKFDNQKRCVVSIIEFFTAEQIEEHLLSLRQGSDQISIFL